MIGKADKTMVDAAGDGDEGERQHCRTIGVVSERLGLEGGQGRDKYEQDNKH